MCLTRDGCRTHFHELGLSYDDVDEGDIAALQLMLNATVKRCRKNPTGSYHSRWRMGKKPKVRMRGDCISEAYLFICVNHPYWRECVSFNSDGFIGFCGEFDDKNAAPILETFCKWCDMMAGSR